MKFTYRYDEKEAEKLSKKLETLNTSKENNLQDKIADDKKPPKEEKEELDESDSNKRGSNLHIHAYLSIISFHLSTYFCDFHTEH